MEAFAIESVSLRVEKTGKGADMRDVFVRDAMTRIEGFARPVLAACSEGDTLRSNLAVLRRFAKYDPVNSIAIRRRIADGLLSAGHYVV